MNDYDKVAEAISFISENRTKQPSLEEIAEQTGLSSFHFQKLFKRWAGVSPKKFLQHLTTQSAKELLKSSASVLDTAFEVGLSGPSRLHDLFIHTEAVTPGEYKSSGEGLQIRYGIHETPFGSCLIASTDKGICRLSFDTDPAELSAEWRSAELIRDDNSLSGAVQTIFYSGKNPLHIHMKGTNFQLKVWQAIINVPPGSLISYGALAEKLDCPKAARAVGTALGQNRIGYLIPCHRVLRNSGEPGGYYWGLERKKAMIAREAVAFSKK